MPQITCTDCGRIADLTIEVGRRKAYRASGKLMEKATG